MNKGITQPIHRNISIGRNEPCLCGSKIKFKYCCFLKIKPPLTQLAEKERQKEYRYYEKRYKRETGKNLNDKTPSGKCNSPANKID
jgi:hypothetical protein